MISQKQNDTLCLSLSGKSIPYIDVHIARDERKYPDNICLITPQKYAFIFFIFYFIFFYCFLLLLFFLMFLCMCFLFIFFQGK